MTPVEPPSRPAAAIAGHPAAAAAHRRLAALLAGAACVGARRTGAPRPVLHLFRSRPTRLPDVASTRW